MCVVWNWCYYDGNVIIFKSGKYSHGFITKTNPNASSLHCKTRNISAEKEKIYCQAVVSCLQLENELEELGYLNTLEVILISKRLFLKKIVIMPEVQTSKINESIVNVPVNVSETCIELQWEGSCEEVILVKLKNKLFFKGHMYFWTR